jgi:hypothetical protein
MIRSVARNSSLGFTRWNAEQPSAFTSNIDKVNTLLDPDLSQPLDMVGSLAFESLSKDQAVELLKK